MSRYINYLFPVAPPNLQKAFRQYRLLRLLLRARWMFWVTLLYQGILFGFDWMRYRQDTLLTNPIHRHLFYTHCASLLFVPAYWFAWKQLGAVRRGKLTVAQRWVNVLYVSFAVCAMPRAAFAYQDRKTLILFITYLMICQIVLLMNHRIRLVSTIVSGGVIIPVVWASHPLSSPHQYTISIEVTLLTLGIFSLSTYLYGVFVREFIQNDRIEEQNRTLKKQAALLKTEQNRAVQELDQRSQELVSYVLQEQQRNAFLLELRARLGTSEPARLTQSIDHQLNQEDRWKYFVTLFEHLHPLFFSQVQTAYPTLNTNDLRLIAMLRLNLNTKEIASLLGISPQSANTARYRLRKRLDLASDASLESFLQQY